ncbi:fused MFS/spermidine synthase [Candidatus Methanodesulfokora washburnensis]|uniref:Polyamine aminopropyltransferase n=2 Tax=Candidatus Methanodesulfokora washburnensis TaxID=2478471 RepID=A0A3R9X2G4_9CREN|nr:fused MFS/spermidine synthase [Candidatus Methanodesulfokores washburnensis]RSN73808.1 spermidine synthase [Candidatus Methanodesulfokores washburnensis]
MSIVNEGFVEFLGRRYYLEMLRPGVLSLVEIKDVIESFRTRAGQLVEVVDLEFLGRSLFMEKLLMIVFREEHIYHETLVHPVMLTHPSPKDVLIIGGGDGGALREVLKHPSVERVDLVELDPDVVDLFRYRIKDVSQGSFESDKLRIIFMDGRKYVQETKEKYDIVIVDVNDPRGQAKRLYTKEFYAEVSRILRDDGIMVTHSEGIYYTPDAVLRIFSAVKANFRIARLARTYVPSFRDEWTFSIGSKVYDPLEADVEREIERRGIKTRFYNALIHKAAFAMGSSMEEIASREKPNEDKNPIEVE